MSWNIWNRPSGSSMVDSGISSNIMESPSPKCYMEFWDMIIYNDILHWSDISLNSDLVTALEIITVFEVITLFREVSIEHLQRLRLANRGGLLLRTPGPVPFGTCICSNVETIHSWTCHDYGSLEIRTSLGISILLYKAEEGQNTIIKVPSMVTGSYCCHRRRLTVFESDEMKFATHLNFLSLKNKSTLNTLRLRLANRGGLLPRIPGPVPFRTCICSSVETIHSWICHDYGSFEFRTSLGISILLYKA